MKLKLVYQTKDNQYFSFKNYVNLSEAKKIYKERLEADENIVEVYCKHFNGWHWHKTHILKENIK